jgi:predicted dehydrogenase
MLKTAVIGYGSIGARHARILGNLSDSAVRIVSRRTLDRQPTYATIEQLLLHDSPGYLVVANETSAHLDTLIALHHHRFTGRILVEKPLFQHASDAHKVQGLDMSNIRVAYNFRYHPVLKKMKELIAGETVIQTHIFTAQYLPSWRPSTDYSASYSASKQKGGGVIRDLSHELDYLLWLFGDWHSLTASGGKISNLNIDSDDHFSAIYHMKSGAHVMLHINYLDRIPKRQIIINTNHQTISADLIAGTVQTPNQHWSLATERDDIYRLQHLDCMQAQPQHACTFEEAMEVMRLIEAMEQSSDNREWIYK